MAAFDAKVIIKKYAGKTVLAISPKVINQIKAEKLAREQFFQVGARPPPANARSDVIWLKKMQRHPTRTYVVMEYPAPPAIEGRHLWNAFDLEESFQRAHRKFLKHSNH